MEIAFNFGAPLARVAEIQRPYWHRPQDAEVGPTPRFTLGHDVTCRKASRASFAGANQHTDDVLQAAGSPSIDAEPRMGATSAALIIARNRALEQTFLEKPQRSQVTVDAKVEQNQPTFFFACFHRLLPMPPVCSFATHAMVRRPLLPRALGLSLRSEQ